MTILQRLFTPNPSTSARHLAKRKHQQSRESYKAFHDEMRAELGMEPIKWGRGK